MSSLSNKQINEISALYEQINLNEATRAQEIVGRITRVASPAFKKGLGIPASQSLSSVAGKKAVELTSRAAGQTLRTGANIARATRDIVGQGIKSSGEGLKGLGMATAKSMKYVAPTAVVGGTVAGLADLALNREKSNTYKAGEFLYKKVKGTQNQSPSGIQQNSVDIFDLIKGHLLDEGYADTEESAHVIMTNMSEEWKKSILEGALNGLS